MEPADKEVTLTVRQNKAVTLTVRQRLGIMMVLRNKCRGKRKDRRRRAAAGIWDVVAIPPEELMRYESPVPGMGTMQHPDAMKRAPDITVKLTLDQAELIEEAIDQWGENKGEDWGPEDESWLAPLMKQLESDAIA